MRWRGGTGRDGGDYEYIAAVIKSIEMHEMVDAVVVVMITVR